MKKVNQSVHKNNLPTNLLHGTAFMNQEHSSICSQKPINGPHPETVHLSSHITPYFSKSHLCQCLPSGLFLWGFPFTIFYEFLISPIHATCPSHLILLDLITITILSEEYKLSSSYLVVLSQYSDWLWTGWPGFDPWQWQRIFLLVSASDRLWGPPSLLSNGYRGPIPGVQCGQGVMLTTHSHLVLRLSMSRSYTSSPPMCHHGV
jgi:hypothetical protein